jgi:hypothetical protein
MTAEIMQIIPQPGLLKGNLEGKNSPISPSHHPNAK